MSIDYDGGMIVGELGKKLNPKFLVHDLLDDKELVYMSTYFDCGLEECYIGFEIDNIKVEDMDDDWLKMIHALHHKFKDLTGVSARLIGTQNIW